MGNSYKGRLVKGVGINDADYKLNEWEHLGRVDGKQKQKLIWRCPYYSCWLSMLYRCYDKKFLKREPTYLGCSVCDEWLTFSKFKSWMEKQDWEGKHLDKDLLVPGNKIYSPRTCIFISEIINKFIQENRKKNNLPIGCSVVKARKQPCFESYCNQLGGKRKHLGFFKTEAEAHKAWLKEKTRLAKELAREEENRLVAESLIRRYETYDDWNKL